MLLSENNQLFSDSRLSAHTTLSVCYIIFPFQSVLLLLYDSPTITKFFTEWHVIVIVTFNAVNFDAIITYIIVALHE